jgi:UDP-N-acetylmuramate dehydrogenase
MMLVNEKYPVPNSLSVTSTASFVIKIKSKKEISEVSNFAKKQKLPLFIIGSGTNIVPRNYVKGVVAIMNLKGISSSGNKITAMAGEKWDNLVKFSIKNGFFGLEALSGIPGTCGAAPVQNIGAYGSEIANYLESVEIYDRNKKSFAVFNKGECGFGYRQSIFKKYPDNFIIISIALKLSKRKNKTNQTRKDILKMRRKKVPNPKIIPNAGSYFVNPIIKSQKIYAGKLIEEVGLKGKKIGKIAVSPNNAMILTNPDRAGFDEIMKAEKFIIKKVFQKSGVLLEREPRIIG